jgi:RND family efflux transporter MFP subunit
MKIHLSGLAAVCLMGLLVAGCGGVSTPAPIPTVVLNANPSDAGSAVTASGVVLPVRRAELGFALTGMVKSVNVSVGDRVVAGQPLIQLDTALWEAEVRVADADLQAEQVAYTYLRRSGTDQEHLDVAAANVQRAEALLGVKQAIVAQATLLAPFDGVVASLDISPAEIVTPGQVVLTLADTSAFEVETTDLSERDAPRVEVGQKAQVDVPALGAQIDGTVQKVSRVASTIGGDAVYKVTVSLGSQPTGLLWGMTATVRILADN